MSNRGRARKKSQGGNRVSAYPKSIHSRIMKPLAPDFGMTVFALFERQRALCKAGLLHLHGGRGPGGGIPATPRNVAIWLLGVLTAEAYSQVGAIENLKLLLRKKGACPITGAHEPLGALETLLVSPPEHRSPLAFLCVTNSSCMFMEGKNGRVLMQWGEASLGLTIVARIPVALIRKIASSVLCEQQA